MVKQIFIHSIQVPRKECLQCKYKPELMERGGGTGGQTIVFNFKDSVQISKLRHRWSKQKNWIIKQNNLPLCKIRSIKSKSPNIAEYVKHSYKEK